MRESNDSHATGCGIPSRIYQSASLNSRAFTTDSMFFLEWEVIHAESTLRGAERRRGGVSRPFEICNCDYTLDESDVSYDFLYPGIAEKHTQAFFYCANWL